MDHWFYCITAIAIICLIWMVVVLIKGWYLDPADRQTAKIEILIEGEWIDITDDVVSFEIDSPFKHN